MIARRYRFHGYNALSFVYRNGKTVRSRSCLLRYAPNPRRNDCRVAVIVGKKVHKSAVVRNRIRRRLFAIIHEVVGDLPPCDLAFTVLDASVAELPQKDIKDTMHKLLQISDILK